jgi:L-2-hydroxyglutarate oxidase LhgO
MSEEKRIDIKIQDGISPEITLKIQEIGQSAKQAFSGIELLNNALSKVDGSQLSKLSDSSAKLTNALARELNAKARLIQAGAKEQQVLASLSLSKQKLATETEKTVAATLLSEQAFNKALVYENKAIESSNKKSLSTQKLINEEAKLTAILFEEEKAFNRAIAKDGRSNRNVL